MRLLNVYGDNLDSSLTIIQKIPESYRYIGIDCEFTGSISSRYSKTDVMRNNDRFYQLILQGTNEFKPLQFGLVFMDENGNTAPGFNTFQFNLQCDLEKDRYSPRSIALLQKSGLAFDSHKLKGINRQNFSEMLSLSGILSGDYIIFTFSGAPDYAYMLKLLINQNLPANRSDFLKLLHDFFPNTYDVKYLADCVNVKGGLQKISERFQLIRHGIQHQAGSDAHLTNMLFYELKKKRYNGDIDYNVFGGQVSGLDEIPRGPGLIPKPYKSRPVCK